MEELTQSTESATVDTGATSGSEAPQSPPVTQQTQHEDVTTPDSTTTDTYPADPNAQPAPDPYGDMLRYKERGYTDKPITDEEFFEKRRREREGVNTAPESEQPQAFDLARSFNDFTAKPEPRGSLPLLTHLYESNQPAYTHLISDAVLSQPEYVLGLLADRGFIPADLVPHPGVDPADEWLADVREDLRDVALNLDPQVWEQIALMDDPEAQARLLEDQKKLQRFEQEAEQRQFEQHQQAIQTAGQAWARNVQNFEQQSEKGHYEHLAKTFTPFEDSALNKSAHDYVIQATQAQALNDQGLAETALGAFSHLADAADARFNRDEKAAKRHESAARRLFATLDGELRQRIDANVEQFKLFFQHAPGARQIPAQTDQPSYVN